jgi:phage tail-like protein
VIASASPHPLADGLPGIFRAALDPDEKQVLVLLARGLDRGEIAQRLDRIWSDVDRLEASARTKLGLVAEPSAVAAERARDDDFVERFCRGLDEVVAPVLVTLDSLDVYVDPQLTPDAFLSWLGGWVALGARLRWPEDSWRTLIDEASDLFRRRGTAWALQRVVELYTGGHVEVDDPGWSDVSPDPSAAPGGAGPGVVDVIVRGGRIQPDDRAQMAGLRHVVREAVPAHVANRVEVIA